MLLSGEEMGVEKQPICGAERRADLLAWNSVRGELEEAFIVETTKALNAFEQREEVMHCKRRHSGVKRSEGV